MIERYPDLLAAADEKYLDWHRHYWRAAFREHRMRLLHQLQINAVLVTSVLCLLVVLLIAFALASGVSSMEDSLHACHAQLRGTASDLPMKITTSPTTLKILAAQKSCKFLALDKEFLRA